MRLHSHKENYYTKQKYEIGDIPQKILLFDVYLEEIEAHTFTAAER